MGVGSGGPSVAHVWDYVHRRRIRTNSLGVGFVEKAENAQSLGVTVGKYKKIKLSKKSKREKS